MSLRVVRHRRAKRDVLRIFVHIGEDDLDAAERFLQAVDRDVRRLGEFPGLGAMREWTDPKFVGVRTLPVSGFRNYLIFYRPTEQQLEVLRVIHGARDLDAALAE